MNHSTLRGFVKVVLVEPASLVGINSINNNRKLTIYSLNTKRSTFAMRSDE
jgi:hypothetical protein